MATDQSSAPEPALLTTLINSAMDPIVAIDRNQVIVLFNPAAEAMFRCAAAEALGAPLERFLPPQLHDTHRRQVADFMHTGSTTRAMGHLRSLTARRADGELFPIEATISHVVIGDRTFGAAILRDISARLAAEVERAAVEARESAARADVDAAAAQRDRLRDILDGLPGGVEILAAPTGSLEFANSGLLELVFGRAQHGDAIPLYGRDFTFLRADGMPLAEGERPAHRALRGERVHNQQLQLERADGSRIPVSAHAAPLTNAAGVVSHAIVVILDATQLRQAEQLKDDFLALISHEFRTPLTTIHGGAQLLRNDAEALDAATRDELLQDIALESERLDRMLGNLLLLTEVLAGRLRPATEPVLIAPLARNVAAELAPRSPHHQFVVEVAHAVPPIEADPQLLEQVLRNLYENAVKYAPAGGRILTTAEADEEEVALRVSDQGIGIAREHVGAVFERFRRVGDDPAVRGMGLGLYLSRGLVEAQGGRISAESPGLGHGTTISVRLPVAEHWADEAND